MNNCLYIAFWKESDNVGILVTVALNFCSISLRFFSNNNSACFVPILNFFMDNYLFIAFWKEREREGECKNTVFTLFFISVIDRFI